MLTEYYINQLNKLLNIKGEKQGFYDSNLCIKDGNWTMELKWITKCLWSHPVRLLWKLYKNVRDLRVLSHLLCDNLTVVDLLKASNPNNNIFVTALYFLMCLLKWKSVLLIRYTDLTSKWLIICTCQPFDGWIKSSLCYLKYWYMFGNWSMFLLQNAQKCICNWQISNFFREAHMLSTYSC